MKIDTPDIAAWRVAERRRLIAERLALDSTTRRDHSRRIAAGLSEILRDPAGLVVSAYWPIRGEPDLRDWCIDLRRRGARTALPVVVAKDTPLAFRIWNEDSQLTRAVWSTFEPLDGEDVRPDVVIAPVVGFDPDCYRLGYGGGFFVRTQAVLPPSTVAIGVGYAQAALSTIHPQTFDVPLRAIVTETGTIRR